MAFGGAPPRKAQSGVDDKLFVCGLGYLGATAASLAERRGWRIACTTRSEERAARIRLSKPSWEVYAVEANEKTASALCKCVEGARCFLTTVPPNENGSDPVVKALAEGLAEEGKKGRLQWVGYVSSTGVYGDHKGARVDESSRTQPVREGAIKRLNAESEWRHAAKSMGLPLHIFRMGGVYGPERNAIQSKASDKSKQRRSRRRYTARVHVADAAQAIVLSMENPRKFAIYNVVDDDPASRVEVEQYLMGESVAAPPPLSEEEKLVDNRFLKANLAWAPTFPSIRSWLHSK